MERSDFLALAFEIETLKMAFHSIKERKTRSFLTVLGIVIGIAAIISLVSIGEGMRATVSEQFEQFGANKIMILPYFQVGRPAGRFSIEFLKEKDLNMVKRTRNIDFATGILMKTLNVEYNGEAMPLTITGVEVSDIEKILSDLQGFDLESGRFMRSGEKYSAIIGKIVAKDLFSEKIKVGDKLKIKDIQIKVVGILKETGDSSDDNMVVLPKSTLEEITNSKSEITVILARVVDVNKVDTVATEIQKKFDDEYGEKVFMVMTTKQLAEQVGNVLKILSIFLGGVATIALIVAGIGIANTMFMSVMERTREIGIMKAIGATNGDILLIFLIESTLLGVIGGIFGCIVGLGMSKALSHISIFSGIQIKTAVTPELLIIGMAFSVVVGVISGLWPARRASKLQPIEALRYE